MWRTDRRTDGRKIPFIKLLVAAKKQWDTSSVLRQALCMISNPLVNSNCSYSPETLNLGKNWRFSVLCDLEIWWMTVTNNRAPLLCYFKLCKSFQTIGEFKLEWQSRNAQFRSKSAIFVPCDLEISRMTLKNNRAPLLSENPKFGSNSIFFSLVTLKFDG